MKAEVRGRDLMSGPAQDRDPLARGGARRPSRSRCGAIVDSVVQCLGQAPPELAQDLIVQGIHLVGGGGMLRGLDRRIAEETALPVHLVDAPLECVVLGAGKCLEAFESLKVHVHGRRPLTRAELRSAREQVLGGLADLPVAVVERAVRGRPRPRGRRTARGR